MSPETIKKNPYSRGKGKLIAQHMLEGKTNEEIFQYIKDNKLDVHYKYPVKMDDMYEVRSRLRKGGLLMEGKLQTATVDANIRLPGLESGLEENKEELLEDIDKKKKSYTIPPSVYRRPDWDVLSTEQINSIPDPKLKMDIMNYKTEISKLKQELKPEFATRGEIDLLRTEISTQVGGIEEKINQLLKMKTPINVEDPEEDEEEEDEEEGIIETPPPKRGSRISVKMNPLEAEETSQTGDDEVMEVEGNIISKKMIGFTAKSLMLFDIAKAQGFPGNIADFVNSCISDAFKGRNIELAVVDKKVIR